MSIEHNFAHIHLSRRLTANFIKQLIIVIHYLYYHDRYLPQPTGGI